MIRFSEAEYAFQTRKKIIPLKMEQGYNADGWLGFILGAKLFFDFSGKYPFEDKMSGLIKEMDTAMSQINGTEVDGKVESTSSPSVSFYSDGMICIFLTFISAKILSVSYSFA
jgi:hypothetical protein